MHVKEWAIRGMLQTEQDLGSNFTEIFYNLRELSLGNDVIFVGIIALLGEMSQIQ